MATFKFCQSVRHLSTTAARQSAFINAPIKIFGVEGRYAHALYSAASKEKQLDAVEKELISIQALLAKDVLFRDYICNPTIQRKVKKVNVEDALKKQKYSNMTVNLMCSLAENGRLAKTGGVINAFCKIMSAHRGDVMCAVTTAKPLDASNLNELKTALQGFLKQGETLQLETKVDSALIGGMVVNIADKYVDMSTATKIKTYTNLINEAV